MMYTNKKGVQSSNFYILDNEKNHSIVYGGNDIAKYADVINMSCEMPEDAHKFWMKEPGGYTTQGPATVLTLH